MNAKRIAYGGGFLALLVAAIATHAAPGPSSTTPTLARVIVVMEAFRNDKGQAAVSLFDQARGFPEDSRRAARMLLLPIRDGRAEAVFADVPYGRYAVGVLHDENRNERMDKSFFGVPREGFGVSGEGHTFRSTPRFADAVFDVTSPTLRLRIPIHYINR